MKIGASILLFIIIFFTIQPIFKIEQKKTSIHCCSKGRCNKKMPVRNKKENCEGMACNPLVGCPYYNLFLESRFSLPLLLPAVKEKIFVCNDNRIIQSNSECWHPPNA